MGFFRNNHQSLSAREANNASVIGLLKAKITQLEGRLSEKETFIEELQTRVDGNLRCLSKLDLNASTCDNKTALTASTSSQTLDTSSSSSGETIASNTNAGDPFEENLVVSRLTVQLEDKNSELAAMQVQLEEQRMLTSHLQEKLQASDQGKATLVQHVSVLEKKIFDQTNQIECLQALNETNTTIVNEMELVQSRRVQQVSSHGSPNQWKMYQKLQSLMEANNRMAQQLSLVTHEKQEALGAVTSLQKKNLNLSDQVDALTKKLEQKNHKLTQMKLEVNVNSAGSLETMEELQHNSVLQEIQQVLDILPSEEDASQEDLKMMQVSMQACQGQLKQILKDHELQMQKTVLQSVQLAESRAKVDTLNAKVEHYETVMDAFIKNSPAVAHSPSSPPSTIDGSTSKAARELMNSSLGIDNDSHLMSPTYSSPPIKFTAEAFSLKTPLQQTKNTLKRFSLPKFMRNANNSNSNHKSPIRPIPTVATTPAGASAFSPIKMASIANESVEEPPREFMSQEL